jgi:hypothetical protein
MEEDNNSIIGTISDLARTAGTTYQNFRGNNNSPATQPAAAPAPALPADSVNWKKILPWAIGGALVLIVGLALIMRRR